MLQFLKKKLLLWKSETSQDCQAGGADAFVTYASHRVIISHALHHIFPDPYSPILFS